MSIDEILKKMETSEDGLEEADAEKRLIIYGRNEIIEKKVKPFIKFLRYFWNPISWMIETAAILSAIIQHWVDFWIIFALLLINALVGIWQEYKADNAIELLKKKLAIKAMVLRNKKWRKISAIELVPGDVVHIRLGDIIPADVILIKGQYLMTDESALTGESLPVEKKLYDMAYSGSVINQGEMDAVVVSTGINTFFGKTAKLVEEAKTTSHLQKAVVGIGNYLVASAIVLVFLIIFIGLFRHESLFIILQFSLVLAVASIPAALPAVLSVTMAVGATSLAKKEAIVSKLVSIEEMAGVDILCCDKTGTITKNQLTVGDPIIYSGFTLKDIMLFATMASRQEARDTIDDAIISKTFSMFDKNEINSQYLVSEFKPFDPISKFAMSTITLVNKANQKNTDHASEIYKVAKGAPQKILELLNNENKNNMQMKIDDSVSLLAQKGQRPLGVAITDGSGEWNYVGIIPLFDPPRDDSAKTLQAAKSMGLEIKMITGDHIEIAKEIAKQIGLKTNIKTEETLLKNSDSESARTIEKANGFAQVYPEHKFHIVELLQMKGHYVAMTGDGVNDAPALKKADVGIAVAGSTDAAKSAAAIVLTKPGISVIIDAIKLSRIIFQRMENYSIFRISETIRVLLFITLSIIIFKFYPITPLMIVLLAILNDVPIMTISLDNVQPSDSPMRWNMPKVLGMATFLGTIGVFTSFFMLFIGKEFLHLNNEILQSFIYLKLAIAGTLTIYVARTKSFFWTIKPALPLFLAILITECISTLITVYGIFLPKMGWTLALIVWSYALVTTILTDFIKVLLYKKFFKETNIINSTYNL